MIPPSPTLYDRLLVALRALVRDMDPRRDYRGVFEYQIVAATSSTVDATPTDTSVGLPSVSKALLRPSILGESVTPSTGSLCLIAFINCDPTRPICVGVLPKPVSATVDASATLTLGPSSASVNIGPTPAPLAKGIATATGFTAMAAGATTLAGLAATSASWTAGLTAGAVAAAFTAMASGGTAAAAALPTTIVKGGP
jgi:hypothetical protein